ncbi:leupaxin-like isoform X1 [Chelonus insularis]|uniref:leupaxin-like isoform X1 n=1 Tax=Chelonus insularis TaxID=460826 RepID=UPI00158C0557|nr:leupaxin-like isoform X1 [Chelonus insularis]
MAMDRTMYGKVQPGALYQPYRITVKKGRDAEAPGYALLADLQNTVASEGSHHVSNNTTPGYGSLNGSRTHSSNYYRTYDNRTSPLPSQSPTYQNREVIEETVKTSVPFPSSGKMPSLNNNLSELDTLLQDLSNARYNSNFIERDTRISSSGVNNGAISPMMRSPSSLSASRPTVDALLEELSTAVPNGDYPPEGRVKVTIEERSTEVQPVYESYPGQQNSLGRSVETHRSYTNGHAASSATKELDDLMASLSEFKINGSTHQHQTITDSPYAKPNKATKSAPSPLPTETGESTRIHITETHTSHQYQPQQGESSHTSSYVKQNQLDSMLGNLQADMSRQGVNTTQKGCCSACEKPIVGQVITALGKTWHPEHFTCTHCREELGTRNFFEREGHPYCENDYHNLFSPRCAYCNGPILDKCVTALEKTWHTEHFFCAQCGKQFGEEGFHERDGKPYCREDYFDMFAPKCGGCNRAIMENYISALNSQWHPDCFVCRDCRQKFQGGSFFDHEGLPYCETHYHAKRGSLCAGCHKPITGRCITAMFRKFHPEHFVCAFCLKQLNKGTFKEQNDKPYCHNCFEKLFG